MSIIPQYNFGKWSIELLTSTIQQSFTLPLLISLKQSLKDQEEGVGKHLLQTMANKLDS